RRSYRRRGQRWRWRRWSGTGPAELVRRTEHPAAAVLLIVYDLEVLARIRCHERLVRQVEGLHVDRQTVQHRTRLEVVADLGVNDRLRLSLPEDVVLREARNLALEARAVANTAACVGA